MQTTSRIASNVFLLVIFLYQLSYCQTIGVFNKLKIDEIDQSLLKKYEKRISRDNIINHSIVKIIDMGEMNKKVSLPLFEKGNAIFNIEHSIKNKSGSISFTAKQDENTLDYTILDDYCFGTIIFEGKKFKIEPLAKKIHILAEVMEPEDECSTPDTSLLNEESIGVSGKVLNKINTASPQVDVLVAYSDDVLTYYGNVSAVNALIDQAISESNTGYSNSSVSSSVNLVSSLVFNLDESNNSTLQALNDFMSSSTVQQQRTESGADVCVLLLNSQYYDAHGRAAGIYVAEGDAYCVVQASSATGYFSFGHEIAHLYGCRHNYGDDKSLYPYVYGHGFQFPVGSQYYRTIMSVVANYTRICYYSNPDIYYSGVSTGTAQYCNNASVLSEEAQRVTNFRPGIPQSISLSNSSGHPRISWAENHESNISTYLVYRNGSMIAEVTAQTLYYIDNDINIMSSPFTYNYYIKASNGTYLSGASSTVSTTGYPQKPIKITETHFSLKDNYPNPFNPSTRISFSVPKYCHVKITVYNTLGKVIQTLVNEYKDTGDYTIVFDASEYPSGIYYYELHSDNFHIVKRMALVK